MEQPGITPKCMILLLLIFLFVQHGNADWLRWRGPNGDGISTEIDWDPAALSKGPKILWKINVGIGFSNIAIQGGYFYTMGSDVANAFIYCFDAQNGKPIWKFSYECRQRQYGPQSTPTVDDKYVYTLSIEGHLHCLDAHSGKVKWFKHLIKDYKVVRPFYGFAGSPVIEGNLVILTGNSYGIALDKTNGKLVWTSPPVTWQTHDLTDTTGSEYATPVLYTKDGKRYVAVFNGYGLYSVTVETGKPNWFYEWVPCIVHAADPIIFENKVFISAGYDVGCSLLDISTGTPKVIWYNKNMSNQFSTCVLINGFLYGCHGMAGSGEGVLRCLDSKNGEIAWEKDYGEPVCLGAAKDKLLILTDSGMLHIAEASPKSYKEIASSQVLEGRCWTPPILSGGRIYARDGMGNIVCIDVRK